MSDLALTWDAELGAADFSVAENDLAREDGLETAVYLSLFTDRRAEDSDVLPEGQTDRRGWWGDAFPAVDGDRIGSRFWLLEREKSTTAVATRAQEYAREALAWLTEDKVAASIEVSSEIIRKGVLAVVAAITRPNGDIARYQYQYTWASKSARRM